jgi:hypothetical protein
VVLIANEIRESSPYDTGALSTNRLPGSIKGITGIGAVSGNPKNLRGSVTISGTTTTATVTFTQPEDDASYFVTPAVSGTTGIPAAGSTRVYATNKTASGFMLNLEAAPGTGNSVTVDWILIR